MTSRSKCQPNLQESVKRETWLSLDFCGRWRSGRKLDRQIAEGRCRSLCSLKSREEFLEGHMKTGATAHMITCYHHPWMMRIRRRAASLCPGDRPMVRALGAIVPNRSVRCRQH